MQAVSDQYTTKNLFSSATVLILEKRMQFV